MHLFLAYGLKTTTKKQQKNLSKQEHTSKTGMASHPEKELYFLTGCVEGMTGLLNSLGWGAVLAGTRVPSLEAFQGQGIQEGVDSCGYTTERRKTAPLLPKERKAAATVIHIMDSLVTSA